MRRPMIQPVIQIDELDIELPEQLGGRAGHIARLVQKKCADLRLDFPGTDAPGKIETITLPDIEVAVPADDNRIAEQIVSAMEQSLKKRG